MAKIFFLFTFFSLLLKPVFSQPFIDLVNLRYQHFPGVKYTSDNREMTINEYTYSFTLPIERKNKDVFIAGGTYDQLNFSFSDLETRKNLYGVNLQLGYLYYWKESKWKTLFMALPKISANKVILSSSTYQQGGVVVFTYQKKANLAYKFGLYYNSEFFGNFFMPLAGLEWKPTSKFNIYGLIPGSFNIEYKLNPNCYTGVAYYNLTQSYRIFGTRSFVRNGDRFWGNMQYKIFVNYYFKKYLVFFTEAGYTLWRRYEAYISMKELSQDPLFRLTKNGPFINVGIAWRIRMDEKI